MTTTITAYSGETIVSTVQGEGAIGDAEPIPARVTGRSADTITATVDEVSQVRTGQLAVTPEGLVGEVIAVDAAGGEITVRPVTAPDFRIDAYTGISNDHGVLSGTGSGLRLGDLDPGAGVLHGNRVVVTDPAQGDRRVGAITVGRVVADQQAGATAVTIRPAVSVDNITEFWIMAPTGGR